jgi:hypothetical protein
MNLRDETALIVRVLSKRDPECVQKKSLELGLAAVRGEARRRRLVRAVSLVGIPVIAALGLLFTTARRPQPVVPSVSTRASAAQTELPALPVIDQIDDQELLALLHGKTVALIGPPGHERLFVFDPPEQIE